VIARIRRSLGAKILLLAALNILLLVAIGAIAAGVRFPRSLEELLMQSAEPRLQDMARRIALDIERTPADEATSMLLRYSEEYDAQFILVHNDGTRIAGAGPPIPDEMILALSSGPPPRKGGGPAANADGRPRVQGKRGGGGPPEGDRPPTRFGPPDPRTGLRMPQTPPRLVTVAEPPRYWIMVRTPIRFAGQADIIAGSLIVVPDGLFADGLLVPVTWLAWVLLGLAVTVACWFPFLRGVTQSLGRMAQATSEIAQGKFETKIGEARADDIGRLSASIEQMAGRLGVMASGQKRFLGDTAHELRSPIGRMQIALEILEHKAADSERSYINDLKEDVDDLRQLTDELLQYARAGLRERGRSLEPVPLLPLVERVIARDGYGATITSAVEAGVVVLADPGLLERALSNVVRNAVTYAGAAGPIHISATAVREQMVVSVADEGPGVSAESLQRVFEPFYREDAARSRKTGGTGLGLAIVRSAIEACDGSVSCQLRWPQGLDVRMVLRSGRAD